MELVEKKAVGASVVEVHGKLIGTPDNCDAMHRLFKSLLDNGQSKIVVDLGNTPWANSQGIGMLIGAFTSVSNIGGNLVLANVPDRINDVLAVTKLNLVFKSFDDDEAAVRYLTGKDPRRAEEVADDQPPIGT
jgi:anti-sigma B factor antagonist